MKQNVFQTLVMASLVCTLNSSAQLSKYDRPFGFNDVYTVYEYIKSNWDGSHSSTVYLYVAAKNKLESFKWSKGDGTATLVTALFDWEKFSVRQFTNHRLEFNKAPRLVAELFMSGKKTIQVKVGDTKDSLALTELPWQSYDFDFAGLGFSWRALRNKKDPFYFHIADAAMVNGNMAFVNKGRAEVKFEGYEPLNGMSCLKYSINGPGLDHKGGYIWIEPSSFMIAQCRITLPDEPGLENGMLQLIKTEKMNPEKWEAFKLKCLANR
jgi:hypothetical protein